MLVDHRSKFLIVDAGAFWITSVCLPVFLRGCSLTHLARRKGGRIISEGVLLEIWGIIDNTAIRNLRVISDDL